MHFHEDDDLNSINELLDDTLDASDDYDDEFIETYDERILQEKRDKINAKNAERKETLENVSQAFSSPLKKHKLPILVTIAIVLVAFAIAMVLNLFTTSENESNVNERDVPSVTNEHTYGYGYPVIYDYYESPNQPVQTRGEIPREIRLNNWQQDSAPENIENLINYHSRSLLEGPHNHLWHEISSLRSAAAGFNMEDFDPNRWDPNSVALTREHLGLFLVHAVEALINPIYGGWSELAVDGSNIEDVQILVELFSDELLETFVANNELLPLKTTSDAVWFGQILNANGVAELNEWSRYEVALAITVGYAATINGRTETQVGILYLNVRQLADFFTLEIFEAKLYLPEIFD